MKVFQINITANWGSTGRIAEGINRSARNSGFEPFIIYKELFTPSSSLLIRVGSKFEYRLHELESRAFDHQGQGSRFSTFFLVHHLLKLQPDIIHLHNIHGSFINYKLLFRFLAKFDIPVVWTFHDCWPFTGHCTYFTSCGCNKWKTGCFNCPQSHTYPRSYFLDNSKRNYILKKQTFTSLPHLYIVSVSHWLDQLVGQSFLKNYPHAVIYNGIDTNTFSLAINRDDLRYKLGIQQGEMMLLGVASPWSERKGFKDFIELCKYLSSEQKIVLIGLTKEQIGSLPQNIIGIERTESTKQLAEYYSAADLFLNLTYEDNYPTTNLEAISCGTPCLTYRTGGSPESITPETGFVVSPGDLNAVMQCIETVQKNGKQFYSTACRNYALAHFRQEDRFQEYIDLYKQILHI